MAGLENDIDEIGIRGLLGQRESPSRRISDLSREVIEFQRATEPLPGILGELIGTAENPELQRYLTCPGPPCGSPSRSGSFRVLLQNILSVNLTLVGLSQNEGGQGPHPSEHSPERRGKEDQRVGGDPIRPHPRRDRLRDELRPHA